MKNKVGRYLLAKREGDLFIPVENIVDDQREGN